jgi:peptidoglycan/LPS O-acetylase OafA/YrhL
MLQGIGEKPDAAGSDTGPWDARLSRGNAFDALRLAFATLVLFEHAYFLPFNSYVAEPLYIFSHGHSDFGSVAVNGFFLISGFLITRSCLITADAKEYFIKRFARIVPGFLLASVLILFVFGPMGADSIATYFQHINWRAALVSILSLHQSGSHETLLHNPMKRMIDGTLWTIRYEFDCYVLVAILWALGLLRRGPVAIILALLLAAFALESHGLISIPSVTYGIPAIFISSPNNWPRLFGYFFMGSAFYLWRDAIPKSTMLFVVSALALVIGLRLGAADLVLMGFGTYVVFFLALSVDASLRLFGRKVDLSYGIYLFGFPIQQLIVAYSHQTVTPIPLFLISLPITCLVAYISWHFIEAPSLRWAHQKTSRLAPVLEQKHATETL